MSAIRLPAELRRRAVSQALHAPAQQQRRRASILFALSALSNSRETQHFNKATKLSRVEHSPALKLIKTSEVDPFAGKNDTRRNASGGIHGEEAGDAAGEGARKPDNVRSPSATGSDVTPVPVTAGAASPRKGNSVAVDGKTEGRKEDKIDNEEALKIGRAFLSEHVQDKRKLRQELKDLREKLRVAEEEAETRLEESESAILSARMARDGDQALSSVGKLTAFLFGMAAMYGLFLLDFKVQGPGKSSDVAEQLAWKRSAALAKQLEASETEVGELKAQMASEKKRLGDKAVSDERQLADLRETDHAHQARMVDWAHRAEELKQAVERKDASTLSKAECDAYLEALVFLHVRDKPQRRWWKGLFWRQE